LSVTLPPSEPYAPQPLPPSAPVLLPWESGAPAPFGPPAAPPGPSLRRELLVAAVAAAAVVAVGFPLGALWAAVAPRAAAVVIQDPSGVRQAADPHPELEAFIGAESWYVLLTAGTGMLVALGVWLLLRRYRGVPVLLGLGLGGVGAGALTLWFGHRFGLGAARQTPIGGHFTAPVNLQAGGIGLWHGWIPYAQGDVLFLAITALLVYLLLAGFSSNPSLRPGEDIRYGISSDC
jgi:hypothetical protein